MSKITIDKAMLEMAIKKLHMLLLPVPAKETTAIMLAERVSVLATEVCGLLQKALAQPQQEPAWWPAVENILYGYGLRAIEFVADFKAAMGQPPQEPVAWMHEWADGERIPLLTKEDDRLDDAPKSVRPLVYGDTAPPEQQSPWCMKMNGCKTKCEDCPDEAPKQRKPLTVDCLGLALDLESQAKRVDSQTAQRAMLAAALGLRNIEAAHGIKDTP